ncbi:MAG: RdgB/HAM1 family non-canonical purine NTP pyrophosphatase [Thermoleophilia bacterium]|nr:RdgB/HAM1 family non-canonical purine NTP pyrophosphatase [Thermoleophilia bacterium]
MTALLSVVLATGNAGKAREFSRLLGAAFDVRHMPSSVDLPEETGATFAANARLKAETVFRALNGEVAVLADDSGLEVAALGGQPGVMSARYAGEDARDEDNVRKLLGELSDVADRAARFVCCLCLALPDARPARGGADAGHGRGDRRMVEVAGFTNGTITTEPRGGDGFGYDPVFQPDGWGLTLAEAPPGEKDGVSHRGAAARALLQRLAAEEA